jgi:hypothetical protein
MPYLDPANLDLLIREPSFHGYSDEQFRTCLQLMEAWASSEYPEIVEQILAEGNDVEEE